MEYLPKILEEGITRGDVPTSPTGGFNAPWLTRNRNPGVQRWTAGSARDKRAVRLTVEVPASDPNLIHWPRFARLHLSNKWRKALRRAGGNDVDWYFYRGEIPVGWITHVELRHECEVAA